MIADSVPARVGVRVTGLDRVVVADSGIVVTDVPDLPATFSWEGNRPRVAEATMAEWARTLLCSTGMETGMAVTASGSATTGTGSGTAGAGGSTTGSGEARGTMVGAVGTTSALVPGWKDDRMQATRSQQAGIRRRAFVRGDARRGRARDRDEL